MEAKVTASRFDNVKDLIVRKDDTKAKLLGERVRQLAASRFDNVKDLIVCEDDAKAKLRERVRQLAAEYRRLKQRITCRICRKTPLQESGLTFLPCGHFITCVDCGNKWDHCPACGIMILGDVRTFLS